eukprot:g26473.t1
MSEADVFLTRHGARIDKEDRHWLAKAGHGRRDDPQLSAAGHLGAAELAAKCAELHEERPFAHIISSPFVRCIETAVPVAQRLGLPIKVEPGICEILQVFPPGFLDAEDLEKQFKCIDLSYEPHTLRGALRGEASDGQAAQRAARTALALRAPGRGFILGEGQDQRLRSFKQGESLGRGAYGEVFKAMVAGRFMAVKKIPLDFSLAQKQAERETWRRGFGWDSWT